MLGKDQNPSSGNSPAILPLPRTEALCFFPPQITFIPVDLEAERFLDHKPMVLPERDARLITPCPNQEATSTYEKSLPSYEQIQRQEVGLDSLPPTGQPRPRSCSQLAVQAKAEVHREMGGDGEPPPDLAPAAGSCPPRPALGDAPLASLLEDMDTPSLEGSAPGSPLPRGRHPPPSTARPGSPAGRQQPSSSRKGAGEEDDLYYGLQEGPDALLEDSDCLFEPEN
ncbi:barttin [Athene cunicularia]|uniref:barttin n=1 Tax=Athene cunicularia TaxID=194338 RepID=UPI000EF67F6A|nr:barttin [Athene cunicularia]